MKKKKKKGAGTRTAATALHRAARQFDRDKVNELIAGGADVNATNNLGRTPLHASVENIMGWPAPLIDLLKAGANPNALDNNGMTPLLVLLSTNSSFSKEATAALIEAGANPNAKDRQGRTAIEVSLSGIWPWSSAGDAIPVLVEAGANLSATDDQGRTILHYLAGMGTQSPMFFIHGIGNTLAEAKVNVSARDKDGNTPLHIAAKTGTSDVYDWLIKHGADLDATNNAGETPRLLALNSTNPFAQFRFDTRIDLSQAIQQDKLEDVKSILKSDPSLLNATNRWGQPPCAQPPWLAERTLLNFLCNAARSGTPFPQWQ